MMTCVAPSGESEWRGTGVEEGPHCTLYTHLYFWNFVQSFYITYPK